MKIRCLEDVHFGTSLKKDKIYEARDCGKGWYAVIDESGEEFAYPPELFDVDTTDYDESSLIMIGLHRKRHGDDYPTLKEIIQNIQIKDKDAVLRYMKSAFVLAVAPGIMQDVLTGEKIPGEWLVYGDGIYSWESETIYYFDKYNMTLPDEFIEHVLKEKTKKEIYILDKAADDFFDNGHIGLVCPPCGNSFDCIGNEISYQIKCTTNDCLKMTTRGV